jgi:hypothetical protein
MIHDTLESMAENEEAATRLTARQNTGALLADPEALQE